MDFLKSFERPDLHQPVMVFAFAGWADAAESATYALKYLATQLGAKKFAEVDPEEFYDFTQVRPHTSFEPDGTRLISWPANDFYAWKSADGSADLVIFVGVEPGLRWRAFTNGILGVMRELNVVRAVQLGALLDAVPHTRQPRITGTASTPELQDLIKGVELRRSRYQGPTGISGVLMDVLRRSDVPSVSVWGHAPHYLQVSPNPKVSLRLVETVDRVLRLNVNVEPLRSQGASFERRVAQALAGESDVTEYVRKLEAQWDRDAGPAGDNSGPLDPQEAVQAMEEFLRRTRKDDRPSAQG